MMSEEKEQTYDEYLVDELEKIVDCIKDMIGFLDCYKQTETWKERTIYADSRILIDMFKKRKKLDDEIDKEARNQENVEQWMTLASERNIKEDLLEGFNLSRIIDNLSKGGKIMPIEFAKQRVYEVLRLTNEHHSVF